MELDPPLHSLTWTALQGGVIEHIIKILSLTSQLREHISKLSVYGWVVKPT